MREAVPEHYLVFRVLELRPPPELLDPPAYRDPRSGPQLLGEVRLAKPGNVHEPGLVTGGHPCCATSTD